MRADGFKEFAFHGGERNEPLDRFDISTRVENLVVERVAADLSKALTA